jgi:hypothetical protein
MAGRSDIFLAEPCGDRGNQRGQVPQWEREVGWDSVRLSLRLRQESRGDHGDLGSVVLHLRVGSSSESEVDSGMGRNATHTLLADHTGGSLSGLGRPSHTP